MANKFCKVCPNCRTGYLHDFKSYNYNMPMPYEDQPYNYGAVIEVGMDITSEDVMIILLPGETK